MKWCMMQQEQNVQWLATLREPSSCYRTRPGWVANTWIFREPRAAKKTGKEMEKQLKPSQKHEILCAHLNSATCSSDSAEEIIPTVVLHNSAHYRTAYQTSLAKKTLDSLLFRGMVPSEMHWEHTDEEFSPLGLKTNYALMSGEWDLSRKRTDSQYSLQ